ncbi:UNVERIFIED_CONTAM: hypothetical protein H355_011471 [Colinus virginianus]|nr:hypothetical protein H355_011471 [Colinus virginianus]
MAPRQAQRGGHDEREGGGPGGKKKGGGSSGGGGGAPVDDSRLRVAIVAADRCKPKKCRQECKRNCPVVRTGKLCIEVDPTSKMAFISEPLCIGCGICVKKCPFEAISIINLPKDLGRDVTHRFGPNTFKLHRLPVPRPGQVKGTVGEVVSRKDETGRGAELIESLELGHLVDRDIANLSGGELQRFCICVTAIQKNNVFMFDEPSSYLDVKQRIRAACVIRSCLTYDNFIIVVEHDLSVLDYLSDYICCLWGKPGAYGVVTMPFSVREGINIFLDGFVPTENLRFREESLNFKMFAEQDIPEEEIQRLHFYEYPAMSKTLGSFKLNVEGGHFSDSEILVMLGQNGTGKSTLIR